MLIFENNLTNEFTCASDGGIECDDIYLDSSCQGACDDYYCSDISDENNCSIDVFS